VAYGFLIAGFIVALVPAKVFAAVFLPTDTFLGVLENAAVGVLAGVFSFIGSIGIVPFAAALWFGGAGFAAVLGVIVSDTITLPVLHLWKSFFGGRATAYIFGAFYSAMVLSTVGIEYLFRALGWLPAQPVHASVTADGWKVDYTLWITIVFLALTGALWPPTQSVGLALSAARPRPQNRPATARPTSARRSAPAPSVTGPDRRRRGDPERTGDWDCAVVSCSGR